MASAGWSPPNSTSSLEGAEAAKEPVATSSNPAVKIPRRRRFGAWKFVDLGIKMRLYFVLLSIALIPAFVNGAGLQAAGKNPGQPIIISTSAISLGSLIQEVLGEGESKDFGGITRFPEIQRGTPVKWRWVSANETQDSRRRRFTVILNRSTDTVSPAYVELSVEEKDFATSRALQYYMLVGLDGVLKGCGFGLVPLDKNSMVIPGPSLAPFKYQDINSPDVRARFQRELDFWLKGVGRKPPAPADPAKKP